MLILHPRHLHLWLVDQRTLSDDTLNSCRQWLSDEEQEKLAQYKKPGLARRYLATRATARHCLSQYSDSIGPKDWQFGTDDNGKPRLENSNMALEFNLSHSGDWVVMAITEHPVGVDVEHITRKTSHSLLQIAQHYFHRDEIRQLETLEGDQQRLYFYQLWTLKEAWLKGVGTGIATGLDRVCLSLQPDGAVSLTLDEALQQDPQRWQFHHYHLGEDYYLSAALNQPPAQAANPHFFKALLNGKPIPLAAEAGRIILA